MFQSVIFPGTLSKLYIEVTPSIITIPGTPSCSSFGNMIPIDVSCSGPPSVWILCWTSWGLSLQGAADVTFFWSWASEDTELESDASRGCSFGVSSEKGRSSGCEFPLVVGLYWGMNVRTVEGTKDDILNTSWLIGLWKDVDAQCWGDKKFGAFAWWQELVLSFWAILFRFCCQQTQEPWLEPAKLTKLWQNVSFQQCIWWILTARIDT